MKGLLGVEAEGSCASYCGGICDGSGVLRIAIDSVGTGAQDSEQLTGMVGKFERACEGKLLISSASPGSAIESYGDLSAGDEAEAPVQAAQLVEAVEKVAGGIGVVPVIAGVVDGNELAGLQ